MSAKHRRPWREPLHERYQVDANGCWLWRRALNTDGYPVMRDGQRLVLAHRFFYEKFVGPIPEGFDAHHVCHERRCVNPAHSQPEEATRHRATAYRWDDGIVRTAYWEIT